MNKLPYEGIGINLYYNLLFKRIFFLYFPELLISFSAFLIFFLMQSCTRGKTTVLTELYLTKKAIKR